MLFRLESPQLDSAIRRLVGTLKYDETLYALQQLDENKFSESRVTAEKIASDRLSLAELLRRRHSLTARAGTAGIFVSELPDLSAGAFLAKGRIIGEIVSQEPLLYVYAQDRDLGKLKVGDVAVVTFRDTLASWPAEVTAVDQISTRLENSPLLQHFGGPIPVYFEAEKSNSYTSVLALYRVTLRFTGQPDIDCGRVATVKISHRERLWSRLKQTALSIVHREF